MTKEDYETLKALQIAAQTVPVFRLDIKFCDAESGAPLVLDSEIYGSDELETYVCALYGEAGSQLLRELFVKLHNLASEILLKALTVMEPVVATASTGEIEAMILQAASAAFAADEKHATIA